MTGQSKRFFQCLLFAGNLGKAVSQRGTMFLFEMIKTALGKKVPAKIDILLPVIHI